MKWIPLVLAVLLIFGGSAFGATLTLKATWTPNNEADMAGYNFYRTDGARTKLNSSLIPHPPSLPYLFSITVSDNSTGTATFILTAVDASGNESLDSNSATFSYDFVAPAAPKALSVSK